MIIDSDGHFVEPLHIWSSYVPRKLHDRIYVLHDDAQRPTHIVAGAYRYRVSPGRHYGPGDMCMPRGLDPSHCRRRSYDDGHPAAYSATKRLETHDAVGIDAAVLFPSVGLALCNTIVEPHLAAAVMTAVNTWAAEYCSTAPHELHGLALLPTTNTEFAAAELRRCVRDYGFVGGCMRPAPSITGAALDDPTFDIVWATAEDLDVPITLHNVAIANCPLVGDDRSTSPFMTHAAAHPMEAMLAFASLIQGRVFERFPRLRIGFAEAGLGWIPFWTTHLDSQKKTFGWLQSPRVSLEPSEAFATRCCVSAQASETAIKDVQDLFHADTVMWSSDFPHYDSELPSPDAPVALPEQNRSKFLSEAASRFYKLDLRRIRQANLTRRDGAGRITARHPAHLT